MEDRSGSVDPICLLRLFDFRIRSHGKQKKQYNIIIFEKICLVHFYGATLEILFVNVIWL